MDVGDTYFFSMAYLINSCFISGLLNKAFLGTSSLLRFSGFLSKAVTLDFVHCQFSHREKQ